MAGQQQPAHDRDEAQVGEDEIPLGGAADGGPLAVAGEHQQRGGEQRQHPAGPTARAAAVRTAAIRAADAVQRAADGHSPGDGGEQAAERVERELHAGERQQPGALSRHP
ncbi:hypothetical protein OIE66_14180 [Nonomuraea sp. NBC_01738]|uniref:hypothetical protein n=1 Tax=Nonomuraea sp. NBC_01738 TaxID=2976003 RepID=UPI002E13F420|nr:hypothetical protein OIE66_14180 [Nonomuraea sp. NBC_01738]